MASNRRLLRDLMPRLGNKLYTDLTHHRILGWQAQATRRRHTKIQRGRIQGATRRAVRLRAILRHGKGRKYAKYLRTNIQPTALWGGAVGGLAPGVLRKLRHQHARIAVHMNHRCHPPDGLRAAGKVEYDPAHQHHASMLRLWHSVLSGDIVATPVWGMAVVGAADELRRCTSPWGGGCPVRALLVTFTRLGLELASLDTIHYQGADFPAQCFGAKEYARLGYYASKHWSDCNAGHPRRAWQGIHEAIRNTDEQMKYYMVQAAANGVWHSDQYDTEELCALCGLEPATQQHRLTRCPRWASLRHEAHFAQAFAYLRHRHSEEDICSFNCTQVCLPMVPEPPLQGPFALDPPVIGFVDGSAYHPNMPELRRASFAWAILQDGKVRVSQAGRVPPEYFEQTVAQAETLALARLLEETTQDLLIYSDCLGVIRIWDRGSTYFRSGKVRYASIWRRIWRAAEGRHISLRKVAAHQKEPPRSHPTWTQWAGNDVVDRLSKAVLRAEEENPVYRRAYYECKTLKALLGLHAKIMTQMASAQEWDYPWWELHQNHEHAPLGTRHWIPPQWLLRFANTIATFDAAEPAPRPFQMVALAPISRRRRQVAKHLVIHPTHHMWIAYDVDDSPVLFCRQCGAYSSKASRLLPKDCGATRVPANIQTPQLSRLRRGLHPQATKGHLEGLRSVTIEEAYDILRTTLVQGRGGARPDFQL
eukprot:6490649-Amphidinium_carterae.1